MGLQQVCWGYNMWSHRVFIPSCNIAHVISTSLFLKSNHTRVDGYHTTITGDAMTKLRPYSGKSAHNHSKIWTLQMPSGTQHTNLLQLWCQNLHWSHLLAFKKKLEEIKVLMEPRNNFSACFFLRNHLSCGSNLLGSWIKSFMQPII